MSAPGWTPVAENSLPPEGVLLDVITPGGDERQLIAERGLWWLPDKSMYCYFVPSFWRVAPTSPRTQDAPS